MEQWYEKRMHGTPQFPFAVYQCNVEDNRKGYPLHWHEELEILYIVSGQGTVTVQGRHLRVATGDVVLIAPQYVHGIEQTEEEMVHYGLLFRPSMLAASDAELLQNHCRRKPCHLPKGNELNEKLAPLLLELSLNRKKADTDYTLMIMSRLYEIAYWIVQEQGESNDQLPVVHANYDRLKVVLEYLRENFAQEITVEQAAAMCGFSNSHFMKLFRELTGTSFSQYVKNLRLDAAAKQLRTTGKRVSDIAEEVGFRNLPYFTRAFGSKFHMPPVHYREHKQG